MNSVEDIIFSPIGEKITNELLLVEIIRSKALGYLTFKLQQDLSIIVDCYSNKPNWHGFKCIEEMKVYALKTLNIAVLKFDENKFTNPQGYIIQIIKYCFIVYLENYIRGISESQPQSVSSELDEDIVQQD